MRLFKACLYCTFVSLMFDFFIFIKNVHLVTFRKIAVGSVRTLFMEKSAIKCVLATKHIVTIWMDAKKAGTFTWFLPHNVKGRNTCCPS